MNLRPLFWLSYSLLTLVAFACCEKNTPLPAEKKKACMGSASSPKPDSSNIPSRSSFEPQLPHFSGQNALFHAEQLCQFVPRHVESAGLENSRLYLEKELKKFGWSTRRQEFRAPTPLGEKNFANLRARFSAQGQASFHSAPAGILSAHMDTKLMKEKFVGANDGASHTGVLLEIARYLAQKKPEQATQIELVFFDGEEALGKHMTPPEDGLYGSLHYVNTTPLPRWMINLDMVGHALLRIRIPSDTHPALYAHFRQAREALRANATDFDVAGSPILDDHLPFQDKGIPALNLIGDFQDNGWWHTPHDTLDLLSPQSLQKTGDFTLQLFNQLLPETLP